MSYKKRMTPELCAALNAQVNLELQASYVYLAMATHCAKSSVALPGFKAYFAKESEEERGHAQQVIDYQILRGNSLDFQPITLTTPRNGKFADNHQKADYSSVKEMVEVALDLEMDVCDSIHQCLDLAEKADDHHAEEWLEDFLDHQMTSIHELECFYTQVCRNVEPGDLYAMDLELQK